MARKLAVRPLNTLLAEPVRNGIYKQTKYHGRGAKMVNMGELFAIPRLKAVPMKRVQLSESECERFLLAPGDLLFARRSLVADGAGKCAVVLEVDEPTTFESSIIRARPDPTKPDSLYLFYFFRSPLGLHHLDTIRRQVAVAGITGSDLSRLEIPIPPLAEQRAIAHLLGSLDDKIELNRRMCATLEEMARAIFRSWFVDFDPVRAKVAAIAEGRDPERAAMAAISGKNEEDLDTLPAETLASLRTTASLFPSSFTDSELGEIPEGWSIGNFGDIAVHRRRNASVASIDPEEPYVGLEHFTRARLGLFDWGVGRGLESQKFRFEKGEVLFGKLRPYFHKVCIAPVAGVCSTDILVLSPINAPWTSYVRLLASEPSMIDHATALSDGTRMPRASWGDLATFPLAKPPQELALAFDRVAGPMLETLTVLPHESRTLAALRDTLLPKLLSGEILLTEATECQTAS